MASQVFYWWTNVFLIVLWLGDAKFEVNNNISKYNCFMKTKEDKGNIDESIIYDYGVWKLHSVNCWEIFMLPWLIEKQNINIKITIACNP